jgi:DNA-binding GntR family transcriptional regulator
MGTPEYERVYEAIKARIESGQLKPGQVLPSIVALAEEYGTSQTTIKEAQRLLRFAGLIRGHQGRGVFVADRPA